MNTPHIHEIEIVAILPDADNTKIVKTVLGYKYHVLYLLGNDDILPAVQYERLLRDAKAKVAALPEIPAFSMKAVFHDGELVATKTSFHLGGVHN